MDWSYKAVLTAMTVGAVLMSARLMGRRVAGLLAGLPVITIPALLWVAQEQGIDFAARSALGSAAACAMAPLFAAGFVLLAPRVGATVGLAGAALVAWAAVALSQGLAPQPWLHLVAAVVSCGGVGWLLCGRQPVPPQQDPADGADRRLTAAPRFVAGEPWATAVLAGTVSAAVSLLAARVGPFWSGVLSTLPLISACALWHLQRRHGASALPGFVAGYLAGVLAKAVFACSFAWLAPRWGLAPAMALALAAGGAAALVVTHWRHGAMGPTLPAVAAARRH
jgi:uncharacterized membrane protein (GlpM family)